MALIDFYILNFAMRRIKSPRFATQGLKNTMLQIPATEHNYISPFPYQTLGEVENGIYKYTKIRKEHC